MRTIGVAAALCCILFTNTGRTDVVPPEMHWVKRQIVITNLHRFPDYYLFGVIGHSRFDSAYIISDSIPLLVDYKTGVVHLYAVRKNILDSIGGISRLNCYNLTNTIAGAVIPEAAGSWVGDALPVTKEILFYEIASVSATVLQLKIRKRVLSFRAGSTDRIEVY